MSEGRPGRGAAPRGRWRPRTPPPGLGAVLGRVPGPLFAGMAALYLVDPRAGLAPPPVLAAMAVALFTAPFRSLLITLAGGLAGYGIGVWLAP